ncbi:MAG TPA: hypothetical protein P5556_09230 [Candidatus Gastranaerophilales bacterium]|nr:hypothetical protein [Candidatus Gastranaerophilales bacterium]
MNSCKIKNIIENSISNSTDKLEKQIEIMFVTSDKTDKIQLSGQGAVKVTVAV